MTDKSLLFSKSIIVSTTPETQKGQMAADYFTALAHPDAHTTPTRPQKV